MNILDSQYCLIWAKKIRAIQYLGGGCSKCGDKNIFYMEFHHIKMGNKKHAVSSMFKNCRWDLIKDEIDKCVLVCRNCHSEIHNQRYNILKSKLLEMKGEKKCSLCGYNTNTAALDFHHIDENDKGFEISRGYRDDRWNMSLDKIIIEMSKCVVICGNCHIIKHINTHKFELLKDDIYQRVKCPRNLQPEVNRDKIWRLYSNGMSGKDIAKELNCVPSTICGAIKKLKEEHNCLFSAP